MAKQRLDLLLVERSMAESRSKAAAMIMAAEVSVDGRVIDKPGTRVDMAAQIQLKAKPRFVSRGGLKLEAALDNFAIDVRGRVCADVGASVGGFTDCLLRAGAARVHAIDVGAGLLDYRLRGDDRVRLWEKTNARHLESLGEPIDFAAIDVSFISQRHILPRVINWLASGADVVSLAKPQFEARKSDIGKGGIVRDPRLRKAALSRVASHATGTGFSIRGIMQSPITGQKGNIEYLMWLRTIGDGAASIHVADAIDRLFAPSPTPPPDNQA